MPVNYNNSKVSNIDQVSFRNRKKNKRKERERKRNLILVFQRILYE